MHLQSRRQLSWGIFVLIIFARMSQAASFSGLGLHRGIYGTEAMGLSADGSVALTLNSRLQWTSIRPELERHDFASDNHEKALAISGNGQVIAGAMGIISLDGFRWSSDAGVAQLAPLGEQYLNNIPTAVDESGEVIVGYSMHNSHEFFAFHWSEGSGIVPLPRLNDAGSSMAHDVSADGSTIVGRSFASEHGYSVAVRWDGKLPIPLMSELSAAHAISADGGTIVGFVELNESVQAFRWTEQTGATPLGDLPGGVPYSSAHDVSADGSIVAGTSHTALAPEESGNRQAFIWDEFHGMQNFAILLRDKFGLEESLRGWILEEATGISADGTVIVGNGKNPLGQSEAWRAVLTPVPEPASQLPAFIGLAALVIVAAKQRLS